MKIIKLPIFALTEFLAPNNPAPADRNETHVVTPQIDMQRMVVVLWLVMTTSNLEFSEVSQDG